MTMAVGLPNLHVADELPDPTWIESHDDQTTPGAPRWPATVRPGAALP